MSENDERPDSGYRGYFEGTEPIINAVEADLAVEALQEVINHLYIQLGEIVYQRDAVATPKEQESLNTEIRTIKLNIGVNRIRLEELKRKADLLAPIAENRESEINRGHELN